MAALEFDINLIHKNCVLYNAEGSSIIQMCAELTARLVAALEEPSSDNQQGKLTLR